MSKTITKKTETFASIFGDDYVDEPVIKDYEVTTLRLEQLIPFKNHPFRLYEGERFDEMVESIKNFGVIVPIVVRKKGLRHEILSGHNRVNAAKVAGLSEIPSVIKEGLTEEEAILIVTETNLMQRSFADLLHSERATVIATRHNAMKKQGIRTDLLNEIEKLSKAPNTVGNSTFAPMEQKLNTRGKTAEEYNLSQASIARYLRIHQLNKELQERVDEGKIAMRAGVDLSYLSSNNQEVVDAIVSEDTFKVDMKKARTLRAYDKQNSLDFKTATAIIKGTLDKPENKQLSIKVQPKIISKYFSPEQKKKDIEKIIEKALEMYFAEVQSMEVVEQVEEQVEEDEL